MIHYKPKKADYVKVPLSTLKPGDLFTYVLETELIEIFCLLGAQNSRGLCTARIWHKHAGAYIGIMDENYTYSQTMVIPLPDVYLTNESI